MKRKPSEEDLKRREFVRSLAGEANQIFRLACGEEDVQREFLRLAFSVYKYSEANGFRIHLHGISFRWFSPNVLRHSDTLPDELVQMCKAWENTYKLFLERNPKVELYYMLKDMSE